MKKSIFYSIILVLITTIFAIQNSEKILVKFLFFKISIHLALIIILSLIIGIAIGFLLNIPSKNKNSKNINNE